MVLEETLTIDRLLDLDYMAGVLARQNRCGFRNAAWLPHDHGWATHAAANSAHPDSGHRSLGGFFYWEIAVPLGFHFYIGLPLSQWRGLLALRYIATL